MPDKQRCNTVSNARDFRPLSTYGKIIVYDMQVSKCFTDGKLSIQ